MKKLSSLFILLGTTLILFSIIIFIFTFYPVITAETSYTFSSHNKIAAAKITPVDEDFGIVIPKIGANAHVIADVNPYNESDYEQALTQGVAHAKGSAYPGESGNVFLFSHSSVNFYDALRYNAIFYLITKLEKGDVVYIFYKKQKLKYIVRDKIIVDPQAISFLSTKDKTHALTLMTCWPPGTTLKRLLIIAQLQ